MVMAKKIVTVCDLDNCGKEGAATTQLAFNGEAVEIDLCPTHLQAVHDALFELLHCGRKIKKPGRPKKKQTPTPQPATLVSERDLVPGRINHSDHDHPNTKHQQKLCRERMLAEARARLATAS